MTTTTIPKPSEVQPDNAMRLSLAEARALAAGEVASSYRRIMQGVELRGPDARLAAWSDAVIDCHKAFDELHTVKSDLAKQQRGDQ